MDSANKRRRYYVTPPVIGWAHTQNDAWWNVLSNKVNGPRWEDYLDITSLLSWYEETSTWKELIYIMGPTFKQLGLFSKCDFIS